MHKLATINLLDDLKPLFAAKVKPAIVDVPKLRFLAIDGTGDPNGDEFQFAVQALYSVAYTSKFRLKKAGIADFKVMPLEGLWWTAGAEGMSFAELQQHRQTWKWTLMIAIPDVLDKATFTAVRKQLLEKGKPVENVRIEVLKEGPAVQILHVGPYAEEERSITAMHAFAVESGYELHGRPHEIYLGDPRKSAPEKLKTILRHPVRKAPRS